MNSVLSNLIDNRNFYSVMIQYKDINEDGHWINCGGDATLMGNQIPERYPLIRKEFVKDYLKSFRFNHVPLRIGFFSGFQGPGIDNGVPIISEYADKRLVRFAMTIPDFYEDVEKIQKIVKDIEVIKDRNNWRINQYPRTPHQSESVKAVLNKLIDIQQSINNDDLAKEIAKADLNLDNYVENFLKLYDDGGIFKTSESTKTSEKKDKKKGK